MQAANVNSLFARAEQAFAAGRPDAARADLVQVQRLAGDHPAVLHLLALVEKKRGDVDASRAAFERALRLSPKDPQILNNYANLLQSIGEDQAALAFFDRALAASPAMADARFNRALLLQELGRADDALVELDKLLAAAPENAKFHSARAAVLRELGRVDEAAEAYDEALRVDPSRLVALHGRARTAMERGEMNASQHYVRALTQKPGDPELVLGMAEALEAEGDALGLELLREAVDRSPGWVLGHEVLARMRSEAGHAEFTDHYERSLERRPHDLDLHLSYGRSLAGGERYDQALRALRTAKKHIGDDPRVLLMEAVLTSEAGDPQAALRLFRELRRSDDDPDLLLPWARAALRAGDAELAAAHLERIVGADPDAISAWAYLDLCWRLCGDRRHDWLSGQPGLFGARELGMRQRELEKLTELLRSLHRSRAHPIGQSLRGGTQTRGRLFWRSEPEIAALREAVTAVVDQHLRALPPKDEQHPLLRHRDARYVLTGSWSVRLSSQGFHVNHIHPEGILSSACYISLPLDIGSSDTREGWLEIGAPPVELNLGLPPLASIKPEPGRLALFPSYMFHGTRPFRDGERLTVAFDVAAR